MLIYYRTYTNKCNYHKVINIWSAAWRKSRVSVPDAAVLGSIIGRVEMFNFFLALDLGWMVGQSLNR